MINILRELPTAGLVVILIILFLFVVGVVLLFATYRRYRKLLRKINLHDDSPHGSLAAEVKKEYARVYFEFGENTNTPAIITGLFGNELGGSLLAERFMNSAVSSFVTLGLFGTFLGLSLSVSSLTDLISLSGSEEWLSIMNSVGGGLVSALSGMGVAFYTSLVGVVCAILFTLLRTIFNPQAQREALENRLELWLDHTVAPNLDTEYASSDSARLLKLSSDLRAYTKTVQSTLQTASESMAENLTAASNSLTGMLRDSKEPLSTFYETVKNFSDSTREFSEITYELRSTVERMDVAARDLGSRLKESSKNLSGGSKR